MKKLTLLIIALALTGCASIQEIYTQIKVARADYKEQKKSDTPAEPAEPGNPGSGSSNSATADGIPAGTIWLHHDVSGWPVTTTLDASISGGKIWMRYDKANVWAAVDGVNANPWAIVQINGQWYAGTWEWLRKGQQDKPTAVLDHSSGKGDHFKVSPLSSWRPKSGERFGLMVSGLARDSKRNSKERSNVSWVVWP